MCSLVKGDMVQFLPESGCKSFPFSTNDGQLHFRREQNGGLVQIGHCCTVVDIHVDEKVMARMEEGTKRTDSDEDNQVMIFTWEDLKSENVIVRKICLYTENVSKTYYQDLCSGFVKDYFKHTREFVYKLFNTYQVCLTSIISGDVMFKIVHCNEVSVEKMESDAQRVLDMCKEFLMKCTEQDVNITLSFQSETGMGAIVATHIFDEKSEDTHFDEVDETDKFSSKDAVEENTDVSGMQIGVLREEFSGGRARPKVRGESAENILKIVRSARGEKRDIGYKRIVKSVEAALVEDTPVPPRAESLDTILCLDSSESMTGAPFHTMKELAEAFVDGLEDIAGEYGLEENVAVVSMTGRARVVQHLTNDYSRIRDAIDALKPGGKSPVFETLAVCLAAIQGKGGVINISDVHTVQPRIIFITDGRATIENEENGPDVISTASKTELIKLVDRLVSVKLKTTPRPIIWIPVGDAEREFLSSLAKVGKGQMVEATSVLQLVKYFRLQEYIGKICSHVLSDPPLQENIREITEKNTQGMSSEDKDMITRTVENMLKTRNYESPDLNNMYENHDWVSPGTKVIRDPDWKWMNQNSEGFGTVINPNKENMDKERMAVWRWKDSTGEWHLYPNLVQQKLRQEFQKWPEATCLVRKGQESFRIFFRTMEEKCLESSIRHQVKVSYMDFEDFVATEDIQ